jgi:hypothetical protein
MAVKILTIKVALHTDGNLPGILRYGLALLFIFVFFLCDHCYLYFIFILGRDMDLGWKPFLALARSVN